MHPRDVRYSPNGGPDRVGVADEPFDTGTAMIRTGTASAGAGSCIGTVTAFTASRSPLTATIL